MASKRSSTSLSGLAVPAGGRANRSRFVILGILSIRPCSGYDIQKAIQHSTAFFWNESAGQIYPALQALEASGEVRRKEDVGTARARAVYSITAAGRRAFDAWIRQPFQPAVERNEMLLKVFFGRLAEPAVTRAHVLQAQAEAHAYLATMQAIELQLQEQLPKPVDRVHVEATVRLGKRVAQAHLEWCDEVLASLDKAFPVKAPASRKR